MVMSVVIKELLARGHSVILFTSNPLGGGLLSGIADIDYQYFDFSWHPSRIKNLLSYLRVQLVLFFRLIRYKNVDCIFYVNTIMPFGATLAGKFIRKKTFVHMHETSVRPVLLRDFLLFVARKCATATMYVSEFLCNLHPTHPATMKVVPNSLGDEFVKKASSSQPVYKAPFRVLMLCSVKKYKGIDEFAALARALPRFEFTLVLNGDDAQIAAWVEQLVKPENLTVFGPQRDTHPFYSTSHIVLNLSHPDSWVETFGLTALEAMAYSLPVIVPNCGGIAELVEDGVNGYKISVPDLDLIQSKLQYMLSSHDIYSQFSKNAFIKSQNYSSGKQGDAIESILLGTSSTSNEVP